jgi:hypothetical protein
MVPRFKKSRIPAEVMDRVRMSAAVAAEQVLEEHVRSAVEMVEEGIDRAPIARLITAYGRLHHLPDQETRKLQERVLAALGSNGSGPGTLDGPRSPLARIRRRLQGRVNPELRDWVERHTARVELTIVDIHVKNALELLRVVEDHMAVGSALGLYTDLLDLRATIAEMVRLKVLKVLHDRESGHVEPLRADRSLPYPLRVAENDR